MDLLVYKLLIQSGFYEYFVVFKNIYDRTLNYFCVFLFDFFIIKIYNDIN